MKIDKSKISLFEPKWVSKDFIEAIFEKFSPTYYVGAIIFRSVDDTWIEDPLPVFYKRHVDPRATNTNYFAIGKVGDNYHVIPAYCVEDVIWPSVVERDGTLLVSNFFRARRQNYIGEYVIGGPNHMETNTSRTKSLIIREGQWYEHE